MSLLLVAAVTQGRVLHSQFPAPLESLVLRLELTVEDELQPD